mmetsp:Transcript_106220/g.298688  ORF Transcript_106220/g.298688 Transcript_106220/m.298688 type:complete len:245 (+) Transcript_106220:831-1565(+)
MRVAPTQDPPCLPRGRSRAAVDRDAALSAVRMTRHLPCRRGPHDRPTCQRLLDRRRAYWRSHLGQRPRPRSPGREIWHEGYERLHGCPPSHRQHSCRAIFVRRSVLGCRRHRAPARARPVCYRRSRPPITAHPTTEVHVRRRLGIRNRRDPAHDEYVHRRAKRNACCGPSQRARRRHAETPPWRRRAHYGKISSSQHDCRRRQSRATRRLPQAGCSLFRRPWTPRRIHRSRLPQVLQRLPVANV